VDDDYVYLLDRFMAGEPVIDTFSIFPLFGLIVIMVLQRESRDSPETSAAYQQQIQFAIEESLAMYNQTQDEPGAGPADVGSVSSMFISH